MMILHDGEGVSQCQSNRRSGGVNPSVGEPAEQPTESIARGSGCYRLEKSLVLALAFLIEPVQGQAEPEGIGAGRAELGLGSSGSQRVSGGTAVRLARPP